MRKNCVVEKNELRQVNINKQKKRKNIDLA